MKFGIFSNFVDFLKFGNLVFDIVISRQLTAETFALLHEESGGTRISVTRFYEVSPVVYILGGIFFKLKEYVEQRLGYFIYGKKLGVQFAKMCALYLAIFSHKNLVTLKRMEICFYDLERG
jgi:hypothetical protein